MHDSPIHRSHLSPKFFWVSASFFQYKIKLLTCFSFHCFCLSLTTGTMTGMPHSPSSISGTSNSTKSIDYVTKSVRKAVKKGTAAISHPFKKHHCKSSNESASVGKWFIFQLFQKKSYILIYTTASNDGNSTREPSVIEINNEDGNKSTVASDETPEEILGKY